MATEIEKQFFETFGIPKIYKTTINIGDLDVNLKEIQAPTLKELYEIAKYDFTTPIYFSWFKRSKRWSEDYPQITDRILLNLILIMNPYAPPVGDTMEEMKEQVLYWCTQYAKKIKHKVQELFKKE